MSDTPESAERRREDFISVIVDACRKYGVLITEDIQENGEERQVFQEFAKGTQWGFIVSINDLERYVRTKHQASTTSTGTPSTTSCWNGLRWSGNSRQGNGDV